MELREQNERLRLEWRERERERRRRRARIRRNRLVAGVSVAVVLALSLGLSLALSGGSSPAAGRAAREGGRVSERPAPATLEPLMPARLVVPGKAPHLSWPTRGQAAVGVMGTGQLGASPRERSVPIASLTKLMTAYLVLRDHPLQPGEAGPSLSMTRLDVAEWVQASENDDSNVQVKLGEVLSEYQLLEALLLPSADNIAEVLGAWDAGSMAAFVAKMNATAHELGLSATHYADPSGVSPGSRSDAADQERLAARLMADPVVRQIVSQPNVRFPVAGTIVNVNPALGVDGIVGVKSGYTSEALGCLATAAYRVVGGHRVLVVSVTLGQPDGLYGAARSDEQLLSEASGALVAFPVATPGERVGAIEVPWSHVNLEALAPSVPATVVGWPQLVLGERLLAGTGLAPGDGRAAAGARTTGSGTTGSTAVRQTGADVGVLEVSGPDGVLTDVPLSASGPIPAVPAGWSSPAAG